MARDRKYGEITHTTGNAIGPNEPVFLFRAKDRLLLRVLANYRLLCEESGSPEAHLQDIDLSAQEIEEWQRKHYTKTPGSPQ